MYEDVVEGLENEDDDVVDGLEIELVDLLLEIGAVTEGLRPLQSLL